MGARTGLYVPLIVRDRAIGVIVAHDKTGRDPRFTQDDQRLAETFACARSRRGRPVAASRRRGAPAASSRHRSSNDGAWRANCTIRPARN